MHAGFCMPALMSTGKLVGREVGRKIGGDGGRMGLRENVPQPPSIYDLVALPGCPQVVGLGRLWGAGCGPGGGATWEGDNTPWVVPVSAFPQFNSATQKQCNNLLL